MYEKRILPLPDFFPNIEAILPTLTRSLKFESSSICTVIPYRRLLPSHYKEVQWPNYTLYSLKNLKELIDQIISKKVHSSVCKKSIRYLVTADQQAYFAFEGRPSTSIPGHYQMAGNVKNLTRCIAAGNIVLKHDGNKTEMRYIHHDSGDFRPSFDSMRWILAILLAHESLLEQSNLESFIPDEIHLQQLDSQGHLVCEHSISKAKLKVMLAEHIELVAKLPIGENKTAQDFNPLPSPMKDYQGEPRSKRSRTDFSLFADEQSLTTDVSASHKRFKL